MKPNHSPPPETKPVYLCHLGNRPIVTTPSWVYPQLTPGNGVRGLISNVRDGRQ